MIINYRRGIVAVDVPPGHKTSMPPVFDVTSSKLAVVRFHGRNHETWDLKGAPPNLRFRHHYKDEEPADWVPRIRGMERAASRVHARGLRARPGHIRRKVWFRRGWIPLQSRCE